MPLGYPCDLRHFSDRRAVRPLAKSVQHFLRTAAESPSRVVIPAARCPFLALPLLDLAWGQPGAVLCRARDRSELPAAVEAAPLGPSALWPVALGSAPAVAVGAPNTIGPSGLGDSSGSLSISRTQGIAAHAPMLAVRGLKGENMSEMLHASLRLAH